MTAQLIAVSNYGKIKKPAERTFSLTHCEAGQAGAFGKAVFEPVVLS